MPGDDEYRDMAEAIKPACACPVGCSCCYKPEAVLGDFVQAKPRLFKFGMYSWLALDHVSAVNYSENELRIRMADGKVFSTFDEKVIERFWEMWERV